MSWAGTPGPILTALRNQIAACPSFVALFGTDTSRIHYPKCGTDDLLPRILLFPTAPRYLGAGPNIYLPFGTLHFQVHVAPDADDLEAFAYALAGELPAVAPGLFITGTSLGMESFPEAADLAAQEQNDNAGLSDVAAYKAIVITIDYGVRP